MSPTGRSARGQATELDRGQDGGTGHDGGADREDHTQALGERLAGGPEQLVAQLAAEPPGRRRARQPPRHREATKRAKLSKEPSQPSRCDS